MIRVRERGDILPVALPCVLLFSLGCGAAGGSAPPDPPAGEVARPVPITTLAPGTPLSPEIDYSQIRFEGPEEIVLVESRDGPFITAGEFNSWLGTYPMKISPDSPATPRRQAVDQMITFKYIVRRARESGYGRRIDPLSGAPDDRSLALTFIRDQMSNVSMVTDEQARQYLATNELPVSASQSTEIPESVRITAAKAAIRGAQLRSEVEAWKRRSKLIYHLDAAEAPQVVPGGGHSQ